MCYFATPPEKFEKETFTGYKRVLVVDGKFISPATGVEYKEQSTVHKAIIKFGIVHSESTFAEINEMVAPTGYAFSRELVGRTAVFETFERALYSKHPVETIVKMTISGELIRGGYKGSNIIAGKFIEKIELLSDKTAQAKEVPVILK